MAELELIILLQLRAESGVIENGIAVVATSRRAADQGALWSAYPLRREVPDTRPCGILQQVLLCVLRQGFGG